MATKCITTMKRLLLIVMIAVLFGSCDRSSRGHLIGVQNRPSPDYADPPGMVFVPMGSFSMGPSDEDIVYSQNAINKTISIPAFYMDETEITNNQYRQFVEWVRDSIARSWLFLAGHQEGRDEFGFDEDEFGNQIDPPVLNWEARIRWQDPEVRDILEYLYIPENERFFRRREINTDTLKYIFNRIDLREAARRSRSVSRAEFVKTDTVAIYPDTLVWIRDFTYAYNEPMATTYFWHPTYDHYPVVGVSWKQARAFTVWRTNLLNSYLASNERPYAMDFLLPSEAEWEYAARGGLPNNPYPWGGPYTRNVEGCFLANFKPLRGNYVADGGYQTVIVAHYPPNDYGLYDMAGNVSEWTRNAYDESFYYVGHDMNPDYQYEARPGDPPSMKRKVVRGGSWKDVAYYLQVSTRTYEYQDTAKSYIGFRCMQTFPGRDRADGRGASNVY
jgi:formylglycine-generating enzyme